MIVVPRIGVIARRGTLGAGAFMAGWTAVATLTWLRYGRTRADLGQLPLLDSALPDPEVDECHSVAVAAPADVTLAAACALDLQASPANKAILAIRTLPARMRGASVRAEASDGLLAETLALGWRRLAEDPGREIVMGAISQPWHGEAAFTPLSPDDFRTFREPGWAKIVWTLSVEPTGPDSCVFRTRTRVATTDPDSRRRFRRYWAIFSPGIILIRWEVLRLVRVAAERRARGVASSASSPLPSQDEHADARDPRRQDQDGPVVERDGHQQE
jgi:hypothetical protein